MALLSLHCAHEIFSVWMVSNQTRRVDSASAVKCGALFNLLAIKIAAQILFSFAAKAERVQRKNKQKVEGAAEGIGKIFRRMVRGKNRTAGAGRWKRN